MTGKTSTWWQDVIQTCGGEESGSWFNSNVRRRVGDGKATLFWEDHWVGTTPLKTQYLRLYNISEQKKGYIIELGQWDEGVWRWELAWKRSLFQWESLF